MNNWFKQGFEKTAISLKHNIDLTDASKDFIRKELGKVKPSIKPWHVFAAGALVGAGNTIGNYLLKRMGETAGTVADTVIDHVPSVLGGSSDYKTPEPKTNVQRPSL